jgi:hypothetical protein
MTIVHVTSCTLALRFLCSSFKRPPSPASRNPAVVTMARSRQECFASNLSGTDLGTALYSPLPFGSRLPDNITTSLGLYSFNTDAHNHLSNSRKVGDIAYFDQGGRYVWVCNAFATQAKRLPVHFNN